MFNDEFDERQLNMWRVGYLYAFMSSFCVEGDGCIVIDRKTNLSVVADDYDAIFFCRVVSYEAP